MSVTFQRVNQLVGINTIYAHPALRPGRYRAVSIVSGAWCGQPTVLAYVVRHRGKLLRCRLH